MIDLVKEFEKEINEEEIRGKKVLNLEAEMFRRSELPSKYTTKIFFR